MKTNMDQLANAVRSEAAKGFQDGIKDAREAIACGMKKAAEQTFILSMALAGIKAAKSIQESVKS